MAQKLLKKKATQKKRQAAAAAKANEIVPGASLIPSRASTGESDCLIKTKHCDGDKMETDQRPPNMLMPVRRRVTSSMVATVGPTQIQRDLQVEVLQQQPPSKPLAFRWLSEHRKRWFLPCMAGVKALILGDSQCKVEGVQIRMCYLYFDSVCQMMSNVLLIVF